MSLSFRRMICAAVLATAVVSVPCFGQEGGRRGGGQGQGPGGRGAGRGGMMGGMMGGGGDMMLLGLLRMEEVKKEIDLMPDQEEGLTKLGESLNADRPQFDFRNASDEDRQKFMEDMRKRMEESSKKVTEGLEQILLEEQLVRLRQISIQQQGFNAFFDATVVKKLELTDDQKKKLEELQEKSMTEMREAMQELFQGGDREAMGKKMTEMRDKQLADAKEVLTDKQKETYSEMRGKDFDLPAGAMMGGFGRGPGGPGGAGGPGGGRGGRGGRGGNRGGDNDA